MTQSPEHAEADTLVEDAPEIHGPLAVGDRMANRVGRLLERAEILVDVLRVRLLPPAVLADRTATEHEDPDDWSFLRRPALLGFVALVMIAFGSSLSSSPFKLEMAGTWFFGEPPPTPYPSHTSTPTHSLLLLGLVAVFGGFILLGRVWYGLYKSLHRRPGVPIKFLAWIFGLWILPMLVIAPVFSRDVYSYAAQGEMMSRHMNPYMYGPTTLGAGPLVNSVDALWAHAHAPYGPLFLMVAGFFASVGGHHELVSVILFRVLAVAGVGLVAWCVPKLARSYGKDAGPMFVLAVLNPLVLLTLIGSAHNDAIMVGLLVAGITAARRHHPVWGVVLCALAASIKVPAALGIIYVGWEWAGSGRSLKERVRPLAKAGAVSLGVLCALSFVSGLGFGWIGNLATPGTVKSWLAPVTAVGMASTSLFHAVGIHVAQAGVMSVVRVTGLLGAGAISAYLLWHSERIGGLQALGLSLLLFVVLGPVVQPWYLSWGIILLTPVAEGRIRTIVIGLSVTAPFIGLPGGRALVEATTSGWDALWVAGGIGVLMFLLLIPLGRWSSSWRDEGLEDVDGELLVPLGPAADFA